MSDIISSEAAGFVSKAILQTPSVTDFCGIPMPLLRLGNIQSLDLSEDSIKIGTVGGFVLARWLDELDVQLTALDVSANSLCGQVADAVIAALHSHRYAQFFIRTFIHLTANIGCCCVDLYLALL